MVKSRSQVRGDKTASREALHELAWLTVRCALRWHFSAATLIYNYPAGFRMRNCLKTHKKGDYVIVFQAPEGANFVPGEQANEFIKRSTVHVPMSNILYAGPNPW